MAEPGPTTQRWAIVLLGCVAMLLSSCNWVLVAEGPCGSTADCPDGHSCTKGLCVPPGFALVQDTGPSADAEAGEVGEDTRGDTRDADPDPPVADAVDGGELDAEWDLPPDTEPAPRYAIEASDGTRHDAVELSWVEYPGATAYRIWRDGSVLATVEGTTYLDTGASPGGAPDGITELSASQGTRLLDVQVSWAPPLVPAGRGHDYAIAPIVEGRDLPQSAVDIGFRAGPPIERYTIWYERRDEVSGSVTLTAPVTAWQDTAANSARFKRSGQRGAEGTCLGCLEYEVLGPWVEYQPVTYRMVAANSRGVSDVSDGIQGWRGSNAPVYWVAWFPYGARDFWEILSSGPEPRVRIEVDDALPTAYRAQIEQRSVVVDRVEGGPVSSHAAECDDASGCAVGECVLGLCALPGTVLIPAGAGETGLTGGLSDVRRRPYRLTRPYWMDRTEVTQAEWTALTGGNPSRFWACGEDCPVENLTWWSALAFANARSAADGLEPCYVLPETCTGSAAAGDLDCPGNPVINSVDGHPARCEGWRLPTDVEWEHAARAMREWDAPGGIWIATASDCEHLRAPGLEVYAWWCYNARASYEGCALDRGVCSGTQPVGQLAPNAWGLYDILGNVQEWVWDQAGSRSSEFADDPIDGTESRRRLRGGSWRGAAETLRVWAMKEASKGTRSFERGVRLVRTRFE